MKTFLKKKTQTSPNDTATANHCTACSPLTDVHKISHPASQPASQSKNQVWNWLYGTRAWTYSARLTTGSPSRLVLLLTRYVRSQQNFREIDISQQRRLPQCSSLSRHFSCPNLMLRSKSFNIKIENHFNLVVNVHSGYSWLFHS